MSLLEVKTPMIWRLYLCQNIFLMEKATLLSILFHSNFESKGEIRRLFKQGAVKLDGKKCNKPITKLQVKMPTELSGWVKVLLKSLIRQNFGQKWCSGTAF